MSENVGKTWGTCENNTSVKMAADIFWSMDDQIVPKTRIFTSLQIFLAFFLFDHIKVTTCLASCRLHFCLFSGVYHKHTTHTTDCTQLAGQHTIHNIRTRHLFGAHFDGFGVCFGPSHRCRRRFGWDVSEVRAKKPELAKLLCENSGADVEWLLDKFNLDLFLVARLERFPGTTITYALIQMVENIASLMSTVYSTSSHASQGGNFAVRKFSHRREVSYLCLLGRSST